MRIALVTLLVIGGMLTLVHAQPDPSAVYGDARKPFVCASKKEPTTGAPSVDQLKDAVRCRYERIFNNYLYLLENLQVEIGKSRPYQASDSRYHDIDLTSPVYPIRGSYDEYQCKPIDTFMTRQGYKGYSINDNCSRRPSPNAEGTCYKTTFGDWQCYLSDRNPGPFEQYLPPPK